MMQLELLKKLNRRVFVARCVHSNAILRFEVDTVPDIPIGEKCHVTTCEFDPKSKLVKCIISNQSANRQGGETLADGSGEHQAAGEPARVFKRQRPDLTK